MFKIIITTLNVSDTTAVISRDINIGFGGKKKGIWPWKKKNICLRGYLPHLKSAMITSVVDRLE